MNSNWRDIREELTVPELAFGLRPLVSKSIDALEEMEKCRLEDQLQIVALNEKNRTADTTQDFESQGKNVQTKATPPKGYTGSKFIVNSTVAELKAKFGLFIKEGDKTHKIPRSTLQDWQDRDDKVGGELEGELKKDHTTHETYYPNEWVKKVLQKYKPKARKP